jgi:hypothetical protein
MFTRLRLFSTILTCICLITTLSLCVGEAAAQQNGTRAQEDPPCSFPDPKKTRCKVGYKQFGKEIYSVYADYDIKRALAGNILELKITVESNVPDEVSRPHRLQIIDLSPSEFNSPLFRIKQSGCEVVTDEITGWLKRVCSYEMEIDKDADPRTHRFNLRLKLNENDTGGVESTLQFPMHVGTNQKGLLTVGEISECCELGLSSADKELSLELINNFTDYDVTVRGVTVKSVPESLLGEWKPMTLTEHLSISDRKTIKIPLKISSVFGTLLDGLVKDKRLDFDFEYEDTYGRKITGLKQPMQVQSKLSGWAWFSFMLAGVLVGTIIKFVRKTDKSTVKQQGLWALGTIAVGILVSWISLAVNIGIDLSSYNVSNSHPIGVFLIGLISAIGGMALIEKFLPKHTTHA